MLVSRVISTATDPPPPVRRASMGRQVGGGLVDELMGVVELRGRLGACSPRSSLIPTGLEKPTLVGADTPMHLR